MHFKSLSAHCLHITARFSCALHFDWNVFFSFLIPINHDRFLFVSFMSLIFYFYSSFKEATSIAPLHSFFRIWMLFSPLFDQIHRFRFLELAKIHFFENLNFSLVIWLVKFQWEFWKVAEQHQESDCFSNIK